MRTKPPLPKPPWLKRRLPVGADYEQVKGLLAQDNLHTVCQEAQCPNMWECFSKHTATFLILGDRCSRNCGFCAVASQPISAPDPQEPLRVARAARKLGLNYVVITSVTRDDLPDGGAAIFAETIREIRKRTPDTLIEVLIPDFQGDLNALKIVLNARPDVLNHNIETVPRLYAVVRPQADYHRSITLIERACQYAPDIPAKSGLMLGLGEQQDEVSAVLDDLLAVGCRMLTLGQYLQPSPAHLPVVRFVLPEKFKQWQETALKKGFAQAASGPFVRSSYHAHALFQDLGFAQK